METNLVSFFRILGRACWYSVTTASVLFIGYMLGHKDKPLSYDGILLAIPFFYSIGFFMVYSICFHYSDIEISINESQLRLTQNESILIVFFFISTPFSFIISLIYFILTDKIPSFGTISSLILYSVILGLYGFLLLLYFRRDKDKGNAANYPKKLTVRHRIIYPALCSIGLSFYYGIYLEIFSNGRLLPYIPIAIVLFYIIASEPIKSPKIFLIVSLSSAVVAIIIPFTLSLINIDQEIKKMGFYIVACIAISAYLAVFESWRMTSFLRNSFSLPTNYNPEKKIEEISPIFEIWEIYYYCNLGILVLCICLIPFTYIYTDYGLYFFLLFTIHSIIAFIIWITLGQNPKINHILFFNTSKLHIQTNWIIIKVILGSIFLIILFLFTFFSNSMFSDGFIPTIIYPFITSLLIFLIYKYITPKAGNELKISLKQFSDGKWIWLWAFLTNQLNFIRIAAIISLFLIIPVFILKTKNTSLDFKVDCAFIFYVVIIIIALICEGMVSIRHIVFKNQTFNKLLGIGHTTRLTTSSVICFIVLLPDFRYSIDPIGHFMLAINLLFTAMGGFALNDYYDSDKDMVNKPHRPIPSNKLTPKMTFVVALIFLSLSSIFSIFNTLIEPFGYLQIFFLISIIAYNYITKNYALYKTIYTALISSLVVAYPILINSLDNIYSLLPVASFFFILGREMFMDILDVQGDSKSGTITLPIRFGVKNVTSFAFFHLFFGIVAIAPLLIKYSSIFRFIIIVISIILFSYVWYFGSVRNKRIAIIYLWVPMIIALSILVK